MGCVGISDGAAIPRRSVSTMGLAALKISERCAHPFPTCDPAPRPTHAPVFAGGGSQKMGAWAADEAGRPLVGPCVPRERRAGLRAASGGPM